MSSIGPSVPRPPRRSQVEKSAETRQRAIQGAITCIHQLGYGATTLDKVAQAAGLSRGAIHYQFSTKLELMLAVVQAVYEEDSRVYASALAQKDPAEGFRGLPEVAWELISRPSGIAVIEIMLACRSDTTLAAKLREIQTAIDTGAHRQASALMNATGYQARADRVAIHRLIVAALRGLAIEALVMGDSIDTPASLQALLEARSYLYNHFAQRTSAAAPGEASGSPPLQQTESRKT